jgi:hypothetical protein
LATHFDDEKSGELALEGGVAWVEAVCWLALQLPPEMKRWMLGMVFRYCGQEGGRKEYTLSLTVANDKRRRGKQDAKTTSTYS